MGVCPSCAKDSQCVNYRKQRWKPHYIFIKITTSSKIMTDSKPNTVEWFNAVAAGSLGEVERMVNEYATSCDPQGETALMIAARGNNLELVKLLQAYETSRQNHDGETSLMIGAKLDHDEVVECLAAAESNIKLPNGDTALHVAVKHRSMKSIGILLEFLTTEKNGDHNNALDCAAIAGDEELVDCILTSTKKYNKKLLEQAEHKAREHSHAKIASYLHAIAAKKVSPGSISSYEAPHIHITKLSAGCSSTKPAEEKLHVITSSTADIDSNKYEDELRILRNEINEKNKMLADKEKALEEMAREQSILSNQLSKAKEQNKDQSVVRPIRKIMGGDYGASNREDGGRAALANIKQNEPFDRDCEGNTPLMLAVEEKQFDRAKELLDEQGGLKNIYGTTALMIAASKGYLDFVQLLLEKEAGLQANSGTTALMKAAHNGHYEICKLLAPKEIGKTRRDGWTATMSAATNNHCDIIDLLTDEIGMQTVDGTTALHKAVVHNHLDAVKRLAGREHNFRLKNGSTAFYMVKKEKNPEMYEFLSRYK